MNMYLPLLMHCSQRERERERNIDTRRKKEKENEVWCKMKEEKGMYVVMDTAAVR
jgi:hypothetical protein